MSITRRTPLAIARRRHEWLTGDAGQKAIAGYEIDEWRGFPTDARKGGS